MSKKNKPRPQAQQRHYSQGDINLMRATPPYCSSSSQTHLPRTTLLQKYGMLLTLSILLAVSGCGDKKNHAQSYTIGGTISGLTGTVTLQDNGGAPLSVSANGAFSFSTELATGSPYSVSVVSQPSGETCTVTNGSGTVGTANVSNIAVSCAANAFSVGGTISGLSQSGLVLANGSDQLSPPANATSFTFPTDTTSGSTYSVAVQTQPTGQTCSIANGSGTLTNQNVSNVQVTCSITASQGTAAQAVIQAAAGGSITVTDPSSPIYGTTVVIPPNALGDAQDTITVGYSTTPPAPLDAQAVADGIIPVGTVVTLAHSGTTPLQLAITITIPYSISSLGSADSPVILYWDTKLQTYQSVQVTAIDQVNGHVTFVTKHWDAFLPVGLPGLSALISTDSSTSSSSVAPPTARTARQKSTLAPSFDTGFLASSDGFEIQNFDTGYPAKDAQNQDTHLGSGGVCFGISSFAAWYYKAKPSTAASLYSLFATQSDVGATHIPQEDAMARELVAKTYHDTIKDSLPQTQLSDLQTYEEFYVSMKSTKTPQLVYISDLKGGTIYSMNNTAHSVLVYRLDISPTAVSFSVYDPNYPYKATGWVAPAPIVYQRATQTFSSWQSQPGDVLYKAVLFDARGTHYDDEDLGGLLTSTQNGGPLEDSHGTGWFFRDLTVGSTLGHTPVNYPGDASGPSFIVDPLKGSALSFKFDCDACAPGKYYLHVYQDNHAIGDATSSGQTVTIDQNKNCQPVDCTLSVNTVPFTAKTAELVSFLSGTPASASAGGQEDISTQYIGYQRGQLNGAPRLLARGINSSGTLVGGQCTKGFGFGGNEGPCFNLTQNGSPAFSPASATATIDGTSYVLANLANLAPCGFDPSQSTVVVSVSESESLLVEGGIPSTGINNEQRISCLLTPGATSSAGTPTFVAAPESMLALAVNSAGTVVGGTCPTSFAFGDSEGPCFNLSTNGTNAFAASTATITIGGQFHQLNSLADFTPCGFDTTQSTVGVAVSESGSIIVEGGVATTGFNDEKRVSCLLTPAAPVAGTPHYVATPQSMLVLGINSAGTLVGGTCPAGFAFGGNEGPCFNLSTNGTNAFSASTAMAVIGGQPYVLQSLADFPACGFDPTQSTVAVAVSETGSILVEGGLPTQSYNDERRISCLLTPAAPINGVPQFDALPL